VVRASRCRANLEHISQSRPDYGLGLSHFQSESPEHLLSRSLSARQRTPSCACLVECRFRLSFFRHHQAITSRPPALFLLPSPLSSEYGTYKTAKVRVWLGFQVKVLNTFYGVPSSLGSGIGLLTGGVGSDVLCWRVDEFGTNKTVKARLWQWLERFSVRKS